MIGARDIELTPAASDGFITLAEAKTALGISGSSEDAKITALLKIGASMLETFCDTILENRTVQETFNIDAAISNLVFYYRPVVSLTSFTVEGEAQTVGDFRLMKGPGIIRRADGGVISPGWSVLTYTAGVGASGAMPEDIKSAATALVKAQYAALQTTPDAPGAKYILSREIADVGSVSYASPGQLAQVAALTGGNRLPPEVAASVGRYRVPFRI